MNEMFLNHKYLLKNNSEFCVSTQKDVVYVIVSDSSLVGVFEDKPGDKQYKLLYDNMDVEKKPLYDLYIKTVRIQRKYIFYGEMKELIELKVFKCNV